jgi:molecular chaperone IbpA
MNAGFSLAPLFRHTVGFDHFDELLNSASRADQSPSYPPYDIIREGEDRYQIVMAVAGFGDEDIGIVVKENVLTVSGKAESDQPEERTWLHRGIARRAFERTFRLADYVRVSSADLRDGLLSVKLERVLPEEAKPRMVPIEYGAKKSIVN